MPSAYFKTEGIVMKKMPYGEHDFLVRFLTPDFGKIDALAKGAKKSSSKLNPHLDVMNHARLQFVKNDERIPTLIDAEIIGRYDDWFLSADSVSLMGRILRTLDMVVLPGLEDAELFKMCVDFFSVVKNEDEAADFLKRFFKHEGYGDSLPPERAGDIIKLWPRLKT